MEKILFISPSTQSKSTWALTVILGIAPTAFFGWKMLPLSSGLNFWVLMFAIFLLSCAVGFVATPYKYILTGAHLVVKRYWRDISIPLSDIKVIRLITDDEKKTIWRSFGYAGPFGYFGIFSSSKLSKLHVCARRYTNLTLVTTESKNYLFAPDDTQLIEAVMQQTGNATANADSPAIEARSSKKWLKFFAVAFFAVAMVVTPFLLVFLAYKEPKLAVDSNAFKMRGIYGVNIPFSEIVEADTIAWREMPTISIRTNGISLFSVHRGNFRTTTGEKIRLSVNSGISPIIRIVDRQGNAYYINRKTAEETRKTFGELRDKNEE